jgi:tetratricopeptide (TPR) repeat protein
MERWDEAHAALRKALGIARGLGDDQWEVGILNDLGVLHNARHRFGDALAYLTKALSGALGTGRLEALIEGNIGKALAGLGRFRAALEHGERGLVLRRDCGDISGESAALRWLAEARQGLGEHGAAIRLCRESIILGKEAMADSASVAESLATLAVSLHETGLAQEAVDCWLEAAELFERRRHPQKAHDARECAQAHSVAL